MTCNREGRVKGPVTRVPLRLAHGRDKEKEVAYNEVTPSQPAAICTQPRRVVKSR